MAPEHTPRARRVLRAAFGFLHDAWLIVGLCVILVLAIEFVYRGQAAARRGIRTALGSKPEAVVAHPYEKEGWWPQWDSIRPAGDRVRYDPYRGWWLTQRTHPNLTVNTEGLRETPQPPVDSSTRRRLFAFGGSVMWGYTARDSFTIPALLARELRARGVNDVEVVNFGQSAFVSTQELITLLLELRRGNVPDYVIFLDGLNDASAAFQSGVAGRVTNEPIAAERWAAGRRGMLGEIAGLSRHSQLLARLAEAAGRKPAGTPLAPPPEKVCGSVASYYRQNTQAVEALSKEFGFGALFFWQPMLSTTRKSLTAFEKGIWEWGPGFRETMRLCTQITEAEMQDRAGRTFISLTNVFDADTTSIFLDGYGHVTEAGNAILARRIADALMPELSKPRTRPKRIALPGPVALSGR